MIKRSQIYLVKQEIGKEQAQILAKKLKDIPFVVGISSNERAAEEVAKTILEYHPEVPLMTSPLLNCDYLQSTEKNYMFDPNELSIRAAIENIHPGNNKIFSSSKKIENENDVLNRLTNILLKAAKDYEGQSISFVCRGEDIRILLKHLKNTDIPIYYSLTIFK